MRTHRFGRKVKLPSTIAIKHQLRQMMLDDLVKEAEAAASVETIHSPREETRPVGPTVATRSMEIGHG